MLKRSQRLRRQRDIRRVIREGRRISTPHVVIYIRSHLPHQHVQAACIVGKNVHLLAVRRHTYQRWLREAVRLVIPLLPPGTEMVWVGKPSLRNLVTFRELRESITLYLPKLTRIS